MTAKDHFRPYAYARMEGFLSNPARYPYCRPLSFRLITCIAEQNSQGVDRCLKPNQIRLTIAPVCPSPP
jgi:hypothetical protein